MCKKNGAAIQQKAVFILFGIQLYKDWKGIVAASHADKIKADLISAFITESLFCPKKLFIICCRFHKVLSLLNLQLPCEILGGFFFVILCVHGGWVIYSIKIVNFCHDIWV